MQPPDAAADKVEPTSPTNALAASPTPFGWRVGVAVAILVRAGSAYLLRDVLDARGRAGIGVLCFIGFVALFSTNLRAINWRTVGCGVALQLLLALFVIQVPA